MMSPRKVSCPSCGANVEIPSSLSRAHCIYCGSQIVFAPEVEAHRAARHADLEIFLDLLKTAREVDNDQDTLRYADKVLELDPSSSYAWYCKGVAKILLSSLESDHYEEASAYLDKAVEIDPENVDARVLRQNLPMQYAQYLAFRAQPQWQTAYQVWAAECIRSSGSIAQRKAAPCAARALATLDKALSLLANEPESRLRDSWEESILLTKVEYVGSLVTHSGFGDTKPFQKRLKELRDKALLWQDVDLLPGIRQKLRETETEIARIEGHGGFFDRGKLENLRKLRQECLERIERAEKLQEREKTG